MANRFTDTDKWKKKWFRELKPIHKTFWSYLCDNCNHAGIWDMDFPQASFLIGVELDEAEIRTVFRKQYVELNHGKKWFLPDFITFQYKIASVEDLNSQNKTHASVIAILKKEGVYKGLARGMQGPKDKDKDKDKDKGGVGGFDALAEFERIWADYPKKVGKKEALRHFRASVKGEEDLRRIRLALEHYKASARVIKGIIQDGKRWFDNWEDWVDYTEPLCKKCKNTGRHESTRGFECFCDCPIGKKMEKEHG